MNFFDPEFLRAAFEAGGTIIAAVGAVFGFVRRERWRRRQEIATLKKNIESEKERAAFAETLIRQEFDAYKLHVAQTFATDEAVARAIQPVADAIDRLGERIDKLFTAMADNRPPASRR